MNVIFHSLSHSQNIFLDCTHPSACDNVTSGSDQGWPKVTETLESEIVDIQNYCIVVGIIVEANNVHSSVCVCVCTYYNEVNVKKLYVYNRKMIQKCKSYLLSELFTPGLWLMIHSGVVSWAIRVKLMSLHGPQWDPNRRLTSVLSCNPGDKGLIGLLRILNSKYNKMLITGECEEYLNVYCSMLSAFHGFDFFFSR
jgi:hypothetical protein